MSGSAIAGRSAPGRLVVGYEGDATGHDAVTFANRWARVTHDRVDVVTMTMDDLGVTVPVVEFREVHDIGTLARLLRRHVR